MRCANVVTRAFDRNRQINWHFSILFMSIQVTLPPSPEKWSARSKSCEHPNNWCRFHLRPFILRYSPWKITTNWQIWALVATLEGLPTNLAPAKVLSLTNVQHQNRWVSQPRAAGISSLYHQTYTKKKKEKNSDQWFDGRWFSSAPSKLHQLLFPKKKVLKKTAPIETHRTEGKLSSTDSSARWCHKGYCGCVSRCFFNHFLQETDIDFGIFLSIIRLNNWLKQMSLSQRIYVPKFWPQLHTFRPFGPPEAPSSKNWWNTAKRGTGWLISCVESVQSLSSLVGESELIYFILGKWWG